MKIRYIDFSPGDWLGGTIGLSLEEEGLYVRICALIWSRGERITEDLLRAATKAHGNKVNALLASLHAKGKITRNGREIGQKRAENELEKAEKRVRKASENGAKGGRPNGLAKAPGSRAVKATTTTTTKEEDSEATPLLPADPVKAIFDRGLTILGQAHRSLLGKMRRDHGDEAVLAGIIACEAEQPSEPVSFFIACMSRAPPINGRGNGKHPGTYRPGPVAALFEGGYNAAEAYIRRHQGDLEPDPASALPLLDRK